MIVRKQAVPRVSVVMPTHNCLKYLPLAVHSILKQHLQDVEIIIVDDGSTDGSGLWLASVARSDPRIRVLKTEGIGPAEARNRGIVVARAGLVAFLDADDRWLPNKLLEQAAFHAQHPGLVLSFGDYEKVDENGQALGNGYADWPRFQERLRGPRGYRLFHNPQSPLFAENPIGTSTVMIRRDAVLAAGGFDPALPSAEDWDLWLRLAEMGPFAITDRVTAEDLVRPDSESSKSAHRLQALEMIHERFARRVHEHDAHSFRRAKARLAVARAQHSRALGLYRGALWHHLSGFLIAPTRQIGRALLVDVRQLLIGRFESGSTKQVQA
jgi:glycosyltransferase involved in cell wall biosynthesis